MCYSGKCKYENHNGDCRLPFSLLQEKNGYVQCGFIMPGQTEEDYNYLIQRQDAFLLKLEFSDSATILKRGIASAKLPLAKLKEA